MYREILLQAQFRSKRGQGELDIAESRLVRIGVADGVTADHQDGERFLHTAQHSLLTLLGDE